MVMLIENQEEKAAIIKVNRIVKEKWFRPDKTRKVVCKNCKTMWRGNEKVGIAVSLDQAEKKGFKPDFCNSRCKRQYRNKHK